MRQLRMTARQRVAAAFALVVSLAGCGERSEAAATTQAPKEQDALDREPLKPIEPAPKLDVRRVALGRRLFHDKRLSSDDTIACSSCHDLAHGGVDGKPHSLGVGGRVGGVNAPTVYNSSLNFVQFWNGRAASLEEQAGGPITNPLEMNSDWKDVIAKLERDAGYASAFKALFKDGVTKDNVVKVIADFERTLLARQSPFDRWLAGDASALNDHEKAGYELFKSVGCVACHQGANVGGNMFQRFGVFGDYFKDRGNVTEADYGRFAVTHAETDRFVFRVPSLRMVAYTAPYFHDGSVSTLTQAVQVMAKYQLGRKLSDEQVASIVAFLHSLAPSEAPAAASEG